MLCRWQHQDYIPCTTKYLSWFQHAEAIQMSIAQEHGLAYLSIETARLSSYVCAFYSDQHPAEVQLSATQETRVGGATN